MTKQDRLYKEVLLRYGTENMAGIDSLLEQGHTGIAEKHAVQKLVAYTQELEEKLGIAAPEVDPNDINGVIKVRNNGHTYYI